MKIKFLSFLLTFLISAFPATTFAQDQAIQGDINGDNITDLIVTRNTDTNKYWFIKLSDGTYSQPLIFGEPTDKELTADFDGDGDVEPTVIRQKDSGEQEWLSLDNSNQTVSSTWGEKDDELKIGFFDSDTKTDKVAIHHESSGQLKWFIKRSSDSLVEIFNWGIENDIPYVANFDDDKINDACISRQVGSKIIWYIRSSKTGAREGIVFGILNDKPIQPADLDGNGIADFIIIRNASEYSTVYIRYNNEDGTTSKIDSFSFGLVGDSFVVGNYNSATSMTLLTSRIGESYQLSSNFIYKPAESPLRIEFGLKNDTFVAPNGSSFKIGVEN